MGRVSQFLDELLSHGRVRVSAEADEADPAAVAVADAAARAELAGEGPPLSAPVAAWAARVLEAGCRFLVYRAHDEPAIAAAVGEPCPEVPSPSASYSADLFLRHLPDVVRLARGLAADDPLVTHLTALGRRWPLSSVGLAGVGDADVGPFVGHPALLRLYADRIIAHADAGRLGPAAVRQAVRDAVGGFAADLAPGLAAALARE